MHKFESHQCFHSFFVNFIYNIFKCSLKICLDISFNIYTKCPLNGTLTNTKTHIQDAIECVNSIGYGLVAVIKAIFSNRKDLEFIMNYIQTFVSINK